MAPADKSGFDDGQMAIIEQTAWRVGDAVATRLKDDFRTIVQLHAATCPVAKELAEFKESVEKERARRRGFAAGVAFIAALGGSGVTAAVLKLIEALTK